jgi:Domain of unknown function (DUF927)
MEQVALAEDAIGAEVYHACASFLYKKRKQDEVEAIRSLWLDVDAGEGKPYADQEEAARAVIQFIRYAGLPSPCFVSSGRGLHCYFPLSVDIERDTWQPYADGLKRACRTHGLHADPARTADSASLLRPPGTHNRKAGERLVEWGGWTGTPYTLDQFDSLIGDGNGFSRRPSGNTRAIDGALGALATSHHLLAHQLAEQLKPDNRDSDPDQIADRCAQVRSLRDNQGNIPEPLWYAVLGVLAYANGGDRSAHAWSAGYEGYTHEETQTRLDRSRLLSGASLCDRFADLDPAGCALCRFRGRINSPIVLGYEDEVGDVRNVGETGADDPHSGGDPGSVLPAEHVNGWGYLPPLPPPFNWMQGSLVYETEVKNKPSVVVLSKNPIYLKSVGRAEVKSDEFSYNFEMYLPKRGWEAISIPAGRFVGAEGMAAMAARGAVIHDRDLFRAYVREAVDMFHQTRDTETRYEQFGWKHDLSGFLWGNRLYTADKVETIAGSEEVKTRAQFLSPRVGGSLERWSAAASTLFAIECEPHAFALLCSFAAPLMRFHNHDEGGAIVSLVSSGSGSGKTMALDAVSSVWGRKKGGTEISAYDTRISKGITLGTLGNLPVIYDEIDKQDSEIIKEFVATFTNGRDRARGTVDGGIRHEARTWQTILFTAANRSVVELVKGGGFESDALAFRILEFKASLPSNISKENGDKLKIELEKNSGWAADRYLKWIVQPESKAWIERELERTTANLWERYNFKTHHRFWVRTLAAATVASVIVKNLDLLAFSPTRIMDWVMKSVAEDRDEPGPTQFEQQVATSLLANYLNEHIQDTLIVNQGGNHGARVQTILHPPRQLLIRYERDTSRFIIAKKSFYDWLMKSQKVSAKETMWQLRKMGVLVEDRRLRTLGAGTDLPGGQTTCIEINGRHPTISGVVAPVEELARRLA